MDIENNGSDSDDFEVVQPQKAQQRSSSFFDGLCQGTKLSDKQKKLRQKVRLQSQMQTNQTTLKQKIQKTNKNHSKNLLEQENNENNHPIVEQKVLVDSNPSKKPSKQSQSSQLKRKSFEQLKLIKPLLKAISEVGYVNPTPIQQLAIPTIMSGKDVVSSSITGSGKTAAFLLPILQRYFHAAAVGYIRALIVTPTRELAIQIHEEFEKLNKYTKLEACLVIGGSSIQRQQQALRNNPEVVISTPGRIIDLVMNSRSVGIENLEMIVFDQADKLLELGFEAEIKQIMSHTHSEVQTILFSATISKQINKLATITSKKPIRISADPDNKTAQKLHQQVIKLKESTQQYRQAVLISILSQVYKEKVIIFFKTKKQCHRIAIILGLLGLHACELHGNLSQSQRIQAFLDFKEGKYEYMLATDLAARGLDIKQVKTVVNFQLPVELTRYIHRIGRTARAGNVGTSLTLCNDEQCLQLKKMSRKTGDKLFKLNIKDETVKNMQQQILNLQRKIQQIVFEERQERQLRLAEMQIKKAENLDQHRDQIMNRPKREWFMTERQKKEIQDQAKKEIGLEPLPQNFNDRGNRGNGNRGRGGFKGGRGGKRHGGDRQGGHRHGGDRQGSSRPGPKRQGAKGRHANGRNGKGGSFKTKGIHKNNRN